MSLSRRKKLGLLLPLVLAALAAAQLVMHYRDTGELSIPYLIGLVIFLAYFGLSLDIVKKHP